MTDLPDDETLLARLRSWLAEARAEAEAVARDHDPARPGDVGDGSDFGLYRLVEAFTALRHEVKLQSRSARALQEQAEALLPALREAMEQFRAIEPGEEQAALAAARPLAEALADLDEALDRGRVGAESARDRLDAEGPGGPAGALDALLARQPWYRRPWVRPYHDEVRALLARDGAAGRDVLDALIEGYELIQGRLRRALDAEQIRRIACVGAPVDPERMAVVALTEAPGVAPGVVVDELRRGYTWRGRVLRFAEVRAARGPAPPTDHGPSPNGASLRHGTDPRD